MNTKAFIYYAPKDVRVEEKNIECEPTDLVVKVLACARCGTDKTIFYKGHYKVDSNAPIILGHELVGEIVEVGKEVKNLTEGIGYKEGKILSQEYLNFRPGEKITLQSRIARYKDGLLILDNPITILSFYINGGYAQYLKVPKELIQSGSVLRLPEDLSIEEGVLVEPAACVLESIFSTPHPKGVDEEGRQVFHAGIKKGGRACIIGSGSVSFIYALFCWIEGASHVFVIVRSEEKAKLVKKILGDKVTVVVTRPYRDLAIDEKEKVEEKLIEELKDLTDGSLFDDVVSACPDSDAQRLMLKLYNPSGYAAGACFGGTHEKVDWAELDMLHYRAAKAIGTSGCSTKSMETVIEWLRTGKLSLKGFVSPIHYTLATQPEEFFTTQSGGLKPVLYPWE